MKNREQEPMLANVVGKTKSKNGNWDASFHCFGFSGTSQKKGRDARRQSDIRQVNLAMEMCYNDTTCGGDDEKYLDTKAGPAAGTNITGFLVVLTDPLNGSDQVYKWTEGTSQYYCLYIKLEAEDVWFCASNKERGRSDEKGCSL